MIRPRQQAAQAQTLTSDMMEESKWLNRNAPTFGNVAPADYADRAKVFNAKCREIGATTFIVVEA